MVSSFGLSGADPEEVLPELTAKQREAVTAALDAGFFDRPQGATADEIAAGLGIARSTFLYHLREAEQIVIKTAIEDDGS